MAEQTASVGKAAVVTQADLTRHVRSDALFRWVCENAERLGFLFKEHGDEDGSDEEDPDPEETCADARSCLAEFLAEMEEATGLPVTWLSLCDMPDGLPEYTVELVGERTSSWWEGLGRPDSVSGGYLREALGRVSVQDAPDVSLQEQEKNAICALAMSATVEAVFLAVCRGRSAAEEETCPVRRCLELIGESGDDFERAWAMERVSYGR